MRYSCNPAKAASNAVKHGVDFHDAAEFEWATALVEADTRTGYDEVRLVAYGAIRGRLHVMVFVLRRPVIWIISLRKASNKEIGRYASEG